MTDTQHIVNVGIADLKTIKAPDQIKTTGLGSCVGVVLYDQFTQDAGMSHIMLPDSGSARQENKNIYKYADTALDILIEKLCSNGARLSALKGKIAGGAQMFEFASSDDLMRIGNRNVQAVQARLQHYKISIVAMDVGGNCGRTIQFDPVTSELTIRTVHKGESII